MDTLAIVFYSVVLAVFLIAVALVVVWFYRHRTGARADPNTALLSPRTLAALNGYCTSMRTAEEAVGAVGKSAGTSARRMASG